MSRLSIGDHVSELNGAHSGRLIDIDGATGYVVQENGVELEFALDRLKPYEAPKVAEKRTLSGPLRDRTLTPAQKALLASVPAELTLAVARSYEAGAEPSATRASFAELPDQKKLEIIRIHLPSLPQRLLAPHVKLVVAMRDLAKAGR